MATVVESRSVATDCPMWEPQAERCIWKHVNAVVSALPRVEAGDVEGIHDMRVASRRLRAALKEFKPLFDPGAHESLKNMAREITQTLGPPRELDVTLKLVNAWRDVPSFHEQDAARELKRHLSEQRRSLDPTLDSLTGKLRSGVLESLTEGLFETVMRPDGCFVDHAQQALKKNLKQISSRYARWLESGDEPTLHDVRIRFKKLRYTTEVYAPAYDAEIKTFLKDLKRAQESLGNWNDQRVLRHTIEEFMSSHDVFSDAQFERWSDAVDQRAESLLAEFADSGKRFFSNSEQARLKALLGSPAKHCRPA